MTEKRIKMDQLKANNRSLVSGYAVLTAVN